MKYEKIIQLDDKELRNYQLCVLSIACDFVRVCEKYDLQYSLSGGSILGAIRHKGFIPWDDDIDVNITRSSYEKLKAVFEQELGEQYYLQTPEKYPELGLMVVQIRKKGTIARRKYDWNLEECGVSMDLYIIENVYENKFKRFVQKNLSLALSFVISAIRMCNNRHIPKEIIALEGRPLNYTKSKLLIGKILRIIPLKTWIKWCDRCNRACHDETTSLVAIPTGRKHFSGEIYAREDMCVFRKEPFETEYFNVPVHAEKYLSEFYGDYMQIPPVDKRERHLFLELDF